MAGTGSAAHLIALANSPEARFAPPGYDYRSAPLGSMPGEENLTVPYNKIDEAVVHVRNWSALLPRKVLIEAVSPQRGGGRACNDKKSPFYGKTPEELRRLVKEEGADMNWYEKKIAPIIFKLRHDGRVWPIPPDLEEVESKDPETGEYKRVKQPKWHLVPPGSWDLYMGNYQRMNSADFMERTKEMEALAGRGFQKFVLSPGNEFGFLEFKREEVRYEPQTIDRDLVAASEIVEV